MNLVEPTGPYRKFGDMGHPLSCSGRKSSGGPLHPPTVSSLSRCRRKSPVRFLHSRLLFFENDQFLEGFAVLVFSCDMKGLGLAVL